MNRKVLVTAGPTHESIDPVRYIGNHSSGRMGYAIADAFAAQGASVTLISGPVTALRTNPEIELVRVSSAKEMYEACEERIAHCDIAVFSAAVADFTPEQSSARKLKRGSDELVIRLQPTRDIAGELGRKKKEGQFFVGFALETDNGLDHARGKLERKNMDLVVLNMAGEQGAGFGSETNRVTMIEKGGKVFEYEQKPKTMVAIDLVDRVLNLIHDA